MSLKKLPKINRVDTIGARRNMAGGAYDFVFSDNLEDWCHNKQLTSKRRADNHRNNGNKKLATRPANG